MDTRTYDLQLNDAVSPGVRVVGTARWMAMQNPLRGGTLSSSEGYAERTSVTLHMVCSLDGFIARKDNDVSWLEGPGSVYEAGVSISQQEAAAFVKTIDCYVLGSRTYEHALDLGWPYGDTPAVVVTSREWPSARRSVKFSSGDLKTLIDVKLAPRYRNIWLVGGAMLCQRFLELGLVDEINLTIAPVLLGDGLRLFGDSRTEKRWNLKNVVLSRTALLSYRTPRLPYKSPKTMAKATLSKQQREELIKALRTRFEKNKNRHQGLVWAQVQPKLQANADKLWSLNEMERTGVSRMSSALTRRRACLRPNLGYQPAF